MQTLHIQLETITYPIYIGEGLLSQIKLIESHLKQKHVAIVTNTTVAPLYLDSLLSLLILSQIETQKFKTNIKFNFKANSTNFENLTLQFLIENCKFPGQDFSLTEKDRIPGNF